MRKFVYSRSAEPFSITSCDISSWRSRWDTIEQCPAIHIPVIACCQAGREPANILTVLQMRGDHALVEEDFRLRYIEIFRGEYGAWKLLCLEVEAGRILFKYYDSNKDRHGQLELNINGTQIAMLKLAIEIPHRDERPETEYTVIMEQEMADYYSSASGQARDSSPRSSTTKVEECRP